MPRRTRKHAQRRKSPGSKLKNKEGAKGCQGDSPVAKVERAKYLSIAPIRGLLDQRSLELGDSLDVSGCIPHEQTASMAFGKHALMFGGHYESVDPSVATRPYRPSRTRTRLASNRCRGSMPPYRPAAQVACLLPPMF